VPEGEPLALARDLFGRDISIAAHRFGGKKPPTSSKYFIGKVCAKWLLKKAWEQNQIQIKDKQIGR